MNKRRWSRGEKWMIVLSCGVCLPGLLLGWIYERQNELPPAPAIVVEVPPANNAFDVWLSALALTTASPRPVTTGSGSCTSSGVDREFTYQAIYFQPEPYTPQYNRAFPLNQKLAYLQKNQSALKLWRSSLDLPLYIPEEIPRPQRHLWSYQSEELEDAIRTQARACWQRRDNDGALSWILNWHRSVCRKTLSFYNGRNHSDTIYRLRGAARRRSNVLDELERLVPHLNAAQMKRLALGLRSNRALLPSRIEVLQISKAKQMRTVFHACIANDFRVLVDEKHPELVEDSKWLQTRFRWANKKAGLARVAKQWDWYIAREEIPLAQRPSWQEMPEELQISSSDPFPSPNGLADADALEATTIDAREVILITAMAIRSFALEHGRNPRTLNELAPRYLQKVEADPFNAPHPLQYSPKPKTYMTVEMDKPIYTLPLPKNAIAVPPSGNVAGQKMVTGYLNTPTTRTLPFLLYSVGADGHDDGGLYANGPRQPPGASRDDVLAQANWFQIPK